MKKIMKFWAYGMIGLAMHSQVSMAQKIDEERMTRDIEVAENVLSTLIKQEMNDNSQRSNFASDVTGNFYKQRTFFGVEVKGTYQEGYGVTFKLPGDYSVPLVITTRGNGNEIYTENISPQVGFYSEENEYERPAAKAEVAAKEEKERTAKTLKEATSEKRKMKADSIRDAYNLKLIKAAKDFIVDYGDLISQLSPNERIVVTNQGENRSWYFKENKRRHLQIEGNKGDVVAFKQGKLTREQALAKLKVVNTEYVEVKEPDMELLASIFNRLYRSDLSTTYFVESNLYYERLKDYGVMYYMQVYSSHELGYKKYSLPTQDIEDVDESTRDKKIVEMYPKFEKDLKDNILEYGRTLKTLQDDEVLVFNVVMTKCKAKGCGIPSSLELTIKGSVLKDFSAAKIDKNTALTKFSVKKGPNQ